MPRRGIYRNLLFQYTFPIQHFSEKVLDTGEGLRFPTGAWNRAYAFGHKSFCAVAQNVRDPTSLSLEARDLLRFAIPDAREAVRVLPSQQ